ncbi:MAG TPA: hypothetical protein VGN59_00935 [Acidimicrobiia bacterium]|jgi:hypothetical protein
MTVACPDCRTDLDRVPEPEMGSAPAGLLLPYCEVTFERDASGSLVEVG